MCWVSHWTYIVHVHYTHFTPLFDRIQEAVVYETLEQMQSCVTDLRKDQESLHRDVLERMMPFAGVREAITRQYLSVDKHWKIGEQLRYMYHGSALGSNVGLCEKVN